MSRRLSMSRYPLALICAYPWSEAAGDYPERPAGREARIGTVMHKCAEAHIKQGEVDPERHDPTEFAKGRELFEGTLRGWLTERGYKHEHSERGLLYDAGADRAHIVAGRGANGYDDGEDSGLTMRGTLDLVRVVDGVLEVEDLKSGQPRNAHEEQLLVQSVAASRETGIEKVRARFVFVRKTKVTPTDWIELDRDRLDEEAGRIYSTLKRLPLAQPNAGDHCFRCPMGKARCPAWVTQDQHALEEAGFFG